MDKNVRIAIIGGGPAGLSVAMYLENKGYDNYVIYEREDHVGGKCHSPVCNGKRYEMGAIMGAPTYYAVHDIEEYCGITHDGPEIVGSYKNPDGSIDSRFDMKLMRIPHLLRLEHQLKKFGHILETKYQGYDVCGHRGVSEGRYEGFAVTPGREPVAGENPNLKDLALPFQEFCEMNGCPLVMEMWVQPFTPFGYGYFDEIPAAYALKYLDFQTMTDFIDRNLWTWQDGTQSIFEALNAKLKHPATLNSDVTGVRRAGGKVYVTANGVEDCFDTLIVTAPLQLFPQYADATDAERELFAKIDYERYDSMAYLAEDGKYPDSSFDVLDNAVPERLGHCLAIHRRWKDEPDQPIVTYVLRRHRTAFGGEELDYEATKKAVLEDLRALGFPARTIDGEAAVINEASWYYFPHIYTEDYQAGWYEKVEAMQGDNSTYYAGEIMSFGDMDETVEYSRDLVERFF